MLAVGVALGKVRDPYKILGAKASATDVELKNAYRKKALQWHPDKRPEQRELAERKFKEINAAWEALKSPEKRKMHAAAARGDFRAQAAGASPPPSPGMPTVRVPLSVSLEELLRGSRRAVAISLAMPFGRALFVIPVSFAAGARDGDTVLRRATDAGVEIEVHLVARAHRRFERRGDDIHTTRWVQAWFGSLRRRGPVRVRPLGARPWPLPTPLLALRPPQRRALEGCRLRAMGHGFPDGLDRGDLIVTLRVRSRRASLAVLVSRALAPTTLAVLARSLAARAAARRISRGAAAVGRRGAPIILHGLVRALATARILDRFIEGLSVGQL